MGGLGKVTFPQGTKMWFHFWGGNSLIQEDPHQQSCKPAQAAKLNPSKYTRPGFKEEKLPSVCEKCERDADSTFLKPEKRSGTSDLGRWSDAHRHTK